MFNFFKKECQLVSPVDGKVVPLEQVPDEVFAQKMAGDGIAINSTGDVFVAPADGSLSMIFKTNHAFGMILDNGIEILVHIGIDTVELDGQGFERIASEGQKIKAGEPVIKINRQFIEEKGYSLITPVLITNQDELKEINYNYNDDAKGGTDVVLTYKVK